MAGSISIAKKINTHTTLLPCLNLVQSWYIKSMKLTAFTQKLISGIEIKGEYEGNAKSGKIIVFSHGFGVKRDSRGMFNEIGDFLKSKSLIIRFDYNDINKAENLVTVLPYSDQAKILKKVLRFVKDEFQPKEINIISHSMGCLVTGILSPRNIEKIILLSPPPPLPITG